MSALEWEREWLLLCANSKKKTKTQEYAALSLHTANTAARAIARLNFTHLPN